MSDIHLDRMYQGEDHARIQELEHENEELRKGIRLERKDSEIAFETAEIYLKERDEALQLLEKARHELRQSEDREVRLIQNVSAARVKMYEAWSLVAGDLVARSIEFQHAMTVPLDRLPANRAA